MIHVCLLTFVQCTTHLKRGLQQVSNKSPTNSKPLLIARMPNHHATHNKKKNKKPKYKPNQAGHQANNQANNQASKQANNQASKQANNQAHNQAGKQANNQANNQAHNQSNKPAHNQSNKQVQQSASFTETFVMCPGLSFRDELREVGDAILPCECADLLNVDNLVELAKYAPSFYERLPEQVQKNATLCEAVLDAHNGNDDMLAKVLAVQDDYDADSALGKKLCQVCALNPPTSKLSWQVPAKTEHA